SVRPPPHATRACPGCALKCASRASPTCSGEGLGVGVAVCRGYVAQQQPPPSPTLPRKGGGSTPRLPLPRELIWCVTKMSRTLPRAMGKSADRAQAGDRMGRVGVRTMKKFLLAGAALVALLGGSASAADLA